MKKYLIFDLDGTLIKSTESIVEIVVDFISAHFWNDFDEKIRYVLSNTKWTALKKQLHMILWDVENIDKINEDLYKKIMVSQKSDFIRGAKEKLHDLEEKYTLFLSTANSTESAKKILKDGWVDTLFAIILWSEKILKWPDHIKIFEEYTRDRFFIEDTIYIGDGEKDREIAMKFWIDFIHVWSDNIDTYEIPSIRYIWPLLDEINAKYPWNL